MRSDLGNLLKAMGRLDEAKVGRSSKSVLDIVIPSLCRVVFFYPVSTFQNFRFFFPLDYSYSVLCMFKFKLILKAIVIDVNFGYRVK